MNRTTRILLVVESVWSFGSGLFLPIFAIYSEQLGGNILDAGIAAGIFLLVTSLLEYPLGKLLDRQYEKWFVIVDYFLEALVFAGYAFITTIEQLFILQIILGIANAFGDPAWESLFDKNTNKKKAGSSWANFHGISGVMTAIGIFIGSLIASKYGFKPIFLMGSAFSLISGIIALRKLRTA